MCNFWCSALSVRVPGCQKITNNVLTRSGTGCFIAVPIWQQWPSKGRWHSLLTGQLRSAWWRNCVGHRLWWICEINCWVATWFVCWLALNGLFYAHKTDKWVSSVLRPHQHSIGYTGDGFYRSKDPTNSIKVLKEKAAKDKNTKKHKENRKYTHTK